MKTQDVLDYFGGPYAVGRALGITGQAVSQWGDNVPMSRRRSVEMAIDIEQARRIAEEKKREQRERRREKRAAQA